MAKWKPGQSYGDPRTLPVSDPNFRRFLSGMAEATQDNVDGLVTTNSEVVQVKSKSTNADYGPPSNIKDSSHPVAKMWFDRLDKQLRIQTDPGKWSCIPIVNNNFAALRGPSAKDGSSQGYSVGSLWCDNSLFEMFVCVDASAGLAKWKRITTRDFDTFRFSVSGAVSTGTAVDGAWFAPFPGKINKIVLYRASTAGTSGSTIIDINIDGVSIFADQADRPEVAFDEATGKAIVVLNKQFAADVKFTMDVDQIDTGGAPSDLDVIVGVEYSGVY